MSFHRLPLALSALALTLLVAACDGGSGSPVTTPPVVTAPGSPAPPPVVPAGTLALSAASYTVAQSAGSLAVSITRSGGSGGAITVSYRSADGTATAGSDYSSTSGTLSWADGDTTAKGFTVAISNAKPYSGSKTFTVTIADPAGGRPRTWLQW